MTTFRKAFVLSLSVQIQWGRVLIICSTLFLFLCCNKTEEMQTQWKGAMHGLWFHICQVRTERFLWAGTQMALSFTCKDTLKADFDVWCQSWGVIMTNYHVWWLKVLEVRGCHAPQLEPIKQNCLFFFVVVPFFVMTLIDDLKYELTFFFIAAFVACLSDFYKRLSCLSTPAGGCHCKNKCRISPCRFYYKTQWNK